MPKRKISSLRELHPGDHIKCPCQPDQDKGLKKKVAYSHHLLVIEVVSDKQLRVIHNDGAEVTEEIKEFSSEKLTVIDYPCKYSASEAISRARSKLGNEWELLTNNCEHFVTWAKNGKGKSEQVLGGIMVGGVGGVAGVGTGVVVGSAVVSGAAAGSVVPIIGNAIGGIVGGVVGVTLGLYAYTHVSNN